jgi:DNA-binding transcriptional ArsR family regulator
MGASDDAYEVLEKPTYVQILLSIVSGKTYATAISKVLKKRQPTVTGQLNELERVGLVKALKRRQAQCYEVNWDLLLDILHGIVNRVVELREEYISPNELALIKKTNLHGVIPKDLVEGFLKEYFEIYQDVGGKTKGFDEIIFSFFGAIDQLSKSELKELTTAFRIDERVLSCIAHMVGFELYGTELTALQCYLKFPTKGEKT